MPIKTAKLETTLNLLNALAQRQEVVRQLTSQLHSGALWRSPDGQLAIAITEGQRTELEAFVKAYLDESDILVAATRAMLASPAGEGG